MTNLAAVVAVNSDVTVMHRDRRLFYHGARCDLGRGVGTRDERRLTGVTEAMLDRLLVVTIGATLIALGAFAINDPAAVRCHFSRLSPFPKLSVSDDRVRALGAALVLIAALMMIAGLLPLRLIAPAQ